METFKINYMTTNVGRTDKTARLIIGFAIAGLGLYYETRWGLVAIVPLVTAFTGFCPLYKLLGITTSKMKTKTE
jgi:hypothetical protein